MLFQNKNVLVLIAIVVALVYYFYNQKEQFVKVVPKTHNVYLFAVESCPHCVRATPIFNKLKDKYDGKEIKKGHKIIFHYIDCTSNKEKDIELVNKHKIQGVPTIILTKSCGTNKTFNNRVTLKLLNEFLLRNCK
jgi:thiol-disulfide isomerase/thioredoxin